MPLAAQTKILRAIQERVMQPLGSSQTISVDVRIISATHQDLEAAISEGRFRQDLYFRIRGIELRVPPLRTRREDILLLANYFLERTVAEFAGTQPSTIPAFAVDAMDTLLAQPWPGNVRELEQAIVAAAAMCQTNEIRAADLPLPRRGSVAEPSPFEHLRGLPLTAAKTLLVEQFERSAIETALADHKGNISAAARQLGLHRQSLQQKMATLGLIRPALPTPRYLEQRGQG